ncbi:MAG: UDP-glucose--hexose-1-phosphate uridylyltransferase [Eubacteriales bacterium]|nr:UDP-glucose--hexose-1-phosphate uridylyltransferase [Eubacteriales bacterium]
MAIRNLTAYALTTELIAEEDVVYTINALLNVLKIDSCVVTKKDVLHQVDFIDEAWIADGSILDDCLSIMLLHAAEKGLLEHDSVVYRDLFDTKIMGVLTPFPREVIAKFNALYKESPEAATNWFYRFSQNTDYIRRYRIKRDRRWKAQTEYGDLDITINLSKPEKDPKAIAAARNAVQSGYPKCQLCCENEGYAGRVDHPARENHRIIPITIQDNPWGFQYSPYVYYNEHCIVFNSQHVPMAINHNTFVKLFDFVKAFPHYFLGSNADLPIVGGSILSHDHFQGGHYTFAMADAPVERTFTIYGFEDVRSGIVKWPMSCIRLSSPDIDRIIRLADKILAEWREYTDESVFIYAYTDSESDGTDAPVARYKEDADKYTLIPHNTITPIARKRGDNYELDLVLRNNITTREHPLGVYHPHAELHHIKKENIGLIEVMGMAILPARLLDEMEGVREAILSGADLRADEALAKHADWVDGFIGRYSEINEENIDDILRSEIGHVFMLVLEDAGVFKRDEKGQEAFDKFIASL